MPPKPKFQEGMLNFFCLIKFSIKNAIFIAISLKLVLSLKIYKCAKFLKSNVV